MTAPPPAPRPPRSRRGALLAAALLIPVACAWGAVAMAALFFDLTTKQWVLAVAGAAVVTEAALYIGAVFLGITAFKRIRARLWPGRGRGDSEPPRD